MYNKNQVLEVGVHGPLEILHWVQAALCAKNGSQFSDLVKSARSLAPRLQSATEDLSVQRWSQQLLKYKSLKMANNLPLQLQPKMAKRNGPNSFELCPVKCVDQMPTIICIMDQLFVTRAGHFLGELWPTKRNRVLVNSTMVDRNVKWRLKRDPLALFVDLQSAWKWECSANGLWRKWTKRSGKRRMSWLNKWARKTGICLWPTMKVEWGEIFFFQISNLT